MRASLGTEDEPISISELVRLHKLDQKRPWEYVYERCDVCGGTGTVFTHH